MSLVWLSEPLNIKHWVEDGEENKKKWSDILMIEWRLQDVFYVLLIRCSYGNNFGLFIPTFDDSRACIAISTDHFDHLEHYLSIYAFSLHFGDFRRENDQSLVCFRSPQCWVISKGVSWS